MEPQAGLLNGLELVRSRLERLDAMRSFGLECAWEGMRVQVKSGRNGSCPLICNIRAHDVRRVSA